MNLALFHPDEFGYVFPMSTGYFPAGIKTMEADNATVLQYVAAHPFRQFIMGRGKDDKLTAANSAATPTKWGIIQGMPVVRGSEEG